MADPIIDPKALADAVTAAKTIADLQKAYTDLGSAINKTPLNSKDFNTLATAAGQAKEKLTDVKNVADDLQSTSSKLATLGQVGNAIASGLSAAQTASALFGASGKELEGVLQKVQAATVLVNGAEQVANLLKEAGILKTVGLTAATTAGTVAEAEFGVTASTAMAAATGGITLAVTAIVGLVSLFSALTSNSDNLKASIDETNASFKDTVDYYGELLSANDEAGKAQSQSSDDAITKMQAEGKSGSELAKQKVENLNAEKQISEDKINILKKEETELKTGLDRQKEIRDQALAEEGKDSDNYKNANKAVEDSENKLKEITGAVKSTSQQIIQINNETETASIEVSNKERDERVKNAKAVADAKVLLDEEGTQKQFEDRKTALKAERDAELADVSLSAEQKLQINAKYKSDLKNLTAQNTEDKTETDESTRLLDIKKLHDAGIISQQDLEDQTYNIKLQGLNARLALHSSESKDYAKLQDDIYDLTKSNDDRISDEKKQAIERDKANHDTDYKEAITNQDNIAAGKKLDATKQLGQDGNQANYDATIEAIDTQALQNKLDITKQFGEATIDYETQLANKQVAITKKKNADTVTAEKSERDARLELAKSTVDGLSSLGQILISDSKKQQEFQKGVALANIAIDTAQAIASLSKGAEQTAYNATLIPGAGLSAPLFAAVYYASGIARILANVAKAKSILSSGNATASGGDSTGGGTSSPQPLLSGIPTAATPTTQLADKNNIQNPQPIKVYVTETDIRNTTNQVGTIYQRAQIH